MKKPALFATITALFAGIFVFLGCTYSNTTSYDFGLGTLQIKGKTLIVKLKGNPTTGFEWSSQVTGEALVATAAEYKSDKTEQPVDGSGGTYVFSYEGIAQGSSAIVYAYARPWENNEPSDVLYLDVKTDKSGNIESTAISSQDKILNASVGTTVAAIDGFERIELCLFGTSSEGDKYVAQRDDTGVLLSHYIVHQGAEDTENLRSQHKGEVNVYMGLTQACALSNMRTWDGFSKSNSSVLDGSSFSLHARFIDQNTVHASGTNAYPDGYKTFYQTFMEAFQTTS